MITTSGVAAGVAITADVTETVVGKMILGDNPLDTTPPRDNPPYRKYPRR